MNRTPFVAFAASLGLTSAVLAEPQPVAPPVIAPSIPWSQFNGMKLPMIQRSVLRGIEGRLGHMAFDLKSGVLFVCCRAAGSVDTLDASGMNTAQSISNIPEPMGMAFAPDLRKLFVSCGDGAVRVLKADDRGMLTGDVKVDFRGEVVPIKYDSSEKRVYVGYVKYFSWLSAETGEKGPEIELSGRPESFVLEDNGKRAFINIAKRGEVQVVDRTTAKVIATWTLKDAKGNYAITADQSAGGTGRLFIAARDPAVLIVLDMKDGREISRHEIAGDADDAWYDAPGKRVYVSCGGGGGKVAMILQKSADEYTVEHMEATNAGASTSVLIPERRKLIVGAPKVGPDGYTFLYIYVLPP